ncbi:uncharacterized protein N7482_004737 [Penicillium canariense]|uniref:25S rRNA (uridine-N(3))-methyltransferase BMT5-like domain-containing protein n=1 Tax=Penicillium canariense TaxID=189055 RepID=A0A9W9I9A0_9EURO|nr:uncharacterized protein N7482_004737 [Penicillium canariense]KAJ5169143.1 hypothetical protein N7482_004737 [Penicillium canariense]
MPRKKQKGGPPPRAHRPGGPAKSGPASASASTNKGSKQDSGAGGAVKEHSQKKQLHMNQRPIVPFLRGDRILLVGEGDFSFARSLAKQYKCRKLCATCYDSQETLFSKYPQAKQHIQEILDSSKPKSKSKPTDADADANESASDSQDQPDDQPQSTSTPTPSTYHPNPKVLFSVDARKLGAPAGGGKDIRNGFPRKERKIPAWKLHQQSQAQATPARPAPPPPPSGPWDVICFNFPHVGGLSTDVNRQVRANQELLVAFFKACVPLLSAAPVPADEDEEEDEWEEDEESEDEDSEGENGGGDGDDQTSGKAVRTGPGQILVSLFDGEPYTLWNIKDLARHAGLQVVTSFKFPWAEYQGYSHARTLGEVEGKDGGRGGWRGEDRLARMYVFEVRQEAPRAGKKNKKRDRDGDGESDSE